MKDEIDPLIEETIEVAAPPGKVWTLVSDLAGVASWSPQVLRTWVRGRPVALGTTTLNLNRKGLLVWPTRSKVVRYDELREIAFRIVENRSVWSFTLEPSGTGTRIVHRREAPDGIRPATTRLVKMFMGGVPQFQDSLREGMRQTLRRIKAEAEAETEAETEAGA